MPSEIQQFYENKTLLITGGTGFLGGYLIEKLLRSCPGIKKMYVLIRSKSNSSCEERFRRLLNDRLFCELRERRSNELQKVSAISGDLEFPGLGLTDEDLKRVVEEVNCVFHVGATVKFMEKLHRAILINIGGTDSILTIAKKMKGLESFVYVSTAYSQSIGDLLEERFYSSVEDGDSLLEMARTMDNDVLNSKTSNILGKWFNTYVFTKHLAEDLIRRNGSDLPIAIVRPPIVFVPYKEPQSGWSSMYDMNSFLIMGMNLGLIHSLRCDPRSVLEVVPVDFAVNHTIAVGWAISTKWHTDKLQIFNYVSGQQNPITWGSQDKWLGIADSKIPSNKKLSHRFVIYTTNPVFIFLIDLIYLPVFYLFNVWGFLLGETHTAYKTVRKLKLYCNAVVCIITRQWNFKDGNTQLLWNNLGSEDKKEFNFDVKDIQWEKYYYSACKGIREYMLKDDFSTLDRSKTRALLLKVFHYILLLIYFLILVFIIYYWYIG